MKSHPSVDGRGRPSKLTPAIIAKVQEILPVALYVETVAAYLGVDRQTFYNWMRRGEREAKRLQRKRTKPLAKEAIYLEFHAAIQKALAEGEFLNALLIRQAASDGKSWPAAAWLLERRFPERWGHKQHIEHSGPQQQPIPLTVSLEQILLAHKELEDWQDERFKTTNETAGTQQAGAQQAAAEPHAGSTSECAGDQRPRADETDATDVRGEAAGLDP